MSRLALSQPQKLEHPVAVLFQNDSGRDDLGGGQLQVTDGALGALQVQQQLSIGSGIA